MVPELSVIRTLEGWSWGPVWM